MLRAEDCAHYYRVYAGLESPENPEDPELMPLASNEFSDLPPAWVVTADIDPLRDDGRDYCSRLRAAGILAELRNEPGLVHGYLRARGVSQKASASFSAIVDAISRFTGRAGS